MLRAQQLPGSRHTQRPHNSALSASPPAARDGAAPQPARNRRRRSQPPLVSPLAAHRGTPQPRRLTRGVTAARCTAPQTQRRVNSARNGRPLRVPASNPVPRTAAPPGRPRRPRFGRYPLNPARPPHQRALPEASARRAAAALRPAAPIPAGAASRAQPRAAAVHLGSGTRTAPPTRYVTALHAAAPLPHTAATCGTAPPAPPPHTQPRGGNGCGATLLESARAAEAAPRPSRAAARGPRARAKHSATCGAARPAPRWAEPGTEPGTAAEGGEGRGGSAEALQRGGGAADPRDGTAARRAGEED